MRITDATVSALNTTPNQKFRTTTQSPQPTAFKQAKPDVSISGEAHLKQRLFKGVDPDQRPPAQINRHLLSSQPKINFLTKDDKTFLSKVYEYAQEQGADLDYADELGRGLADYRADQKLKTSLKRGSDLDASGHKVTYSFTAKDAATANRILASQAIKTTQLDRGFIRKTMDEDYGAKNHPDFEFMEKVVNKFSAMADDSPLGDKFATHSIADKNYVRHVSKDTFKYRKGVDQIVEKTPGKGKGKPGVIRDPSSATPSTLKEILRGIIFKAIGSGSKNGLPSLAEFLMRNGR